MEKKKKKSYKSGGERKKKKSKIIHKALSSAMCVAADARATSANATLTAGLAEFKARTASATQALSCAACNKPLFSALLLGCGHLVDEACYLRAGIQQATLITSSSTSSTQQNTDYSFAFCCPVCGDRCTAPVRPASAIDSALEALLFEPKDIEERKQRLDALLQIRREARASCPAQGPVAELLLINHPHTCDAFFATIDDAFFHSHENIDETLEINDDSILACENHQVDNTSEFVHTYLDDANEALASSHLHPTMNHDNVATSTDNLILCDGCGELGHDQRNCPHRSDLSDFDDSASMEL